MFFCFLVLLLKATYLLFPNHYLWFGNGNAQITVMRSISNVCVDLVVRKMSNSENHTMKLGDQIDQLRSEQTQFISISNKEWYSLFRDEIRNSIAIEGVFANRNDLQDVLERNKKTNKAKAAAILGYFESASSMYEYANNQFREDEFLLRLADIKQIHTLLMRYEKQMGTYSGDIGDFRRENVEVAQATFQPIDVYFVRDAMKLLIRWFNTRLRETKTDPLWLSAICHIWFETIHPFRDGNGRAGRILLSYLLIGTGYVNVAIKGVAKKDRDVYYSALERCDDCFEALHQSMMQGHKLRVHDVDKATRKQDVEPFVTILQNSLKDAVTRLQKQHAPSNPNTLLPLRELARQFDYSQDYLRNLINRGQLKGQKQGKLWYVRISDMYHYMKQR